MNILVTGGEGFIGKNLIAELRNHDVYNVYACGRHTDPLIFDEYCQQADCVVHLAGVNRPQEQSDFMKENVCYTASVLEKLRTYRNTCPVIVSSSIQAELDNPYGSSKRAMEELLLEYNAQTGAPVVIYRFPNIFGKWCKPNYNSVVATFCHNVARDLPISVHAESTLLKLVYIDDVVQELISALSEDRQGTVEFCEIPLVYTISLGEVADLIRSFKRSREEFTTPDVSNPFKKKLYSTYLSYLPEQQFNYDLRMNVDDRGSFTEFLKTPSMGQISVNITKPGIVRGNHWHHTKNEKFLVVHGTGIIRFRKVETDEIMEYLVSGDMLQVVDVPPGYTHNIENLGNSDMVTIMWANEWFDPEQPDTYYQEV